MPASALKRSGQARSAFTRTPRPAGDRLEFMAEAGPGDFIFVPPFVPHQEINASSSESLECVVVRSDNEAVVVNLDIEPVEKPDEVLWVDPIHKG
jgi:uncharacterized RmlC-like cupin family protein